MTEDKKLAVIYCRVSDPKQVIDGHGLSSQETRCREYAKHKNYEVVEVFREEGVTGKIFDRPRMIEMLDFLRKQKKKTEYVVIIDDISRLARDIETHIKLRTDISSAGGKLESPSIEFGEDSDSRLVEHLLACVAAHQREKNAEQVKNRMRARVQSGYWIFKAPVGYKVEKVKGHGKILVRDEPLASIIQETLESFAAGKFETQTEVQYYLELQPSYPKDRKGKIHPQRIADLLNRLIYTGYFTYEKWGIGLTKGQHEPIITMDTWKKIQDRLNQSAKVPYRKDVTEDFPLRGFVLCDCCGHPYTANWTKGRSGKYPYYICRNKGCEMYGKSIKRDVMQDEFETFLKSSLPTNKTIGLIEKTLLKTWHRKCDDLLSHKKDLEKERRSIEKKIDLFFDRIAEANSASLMQKYEKQITELEKKKVALEDRIASTETTEVNYEKTIQTALEFFQNSHALWVSGDIKDKRTILRAMFKEQLRYHPKEGFRTAQYSLPFKLSREFNKSNSSLVEGTGFEPVYTYVGRFTVCCL